MTVNPKTQIKLRWRFRWSHESRKEDFETLFLSSGGHWFSRIQLGGQGKAAHARHDGWLAGRPTSEWNYALAMNGTTAHGLVVQEHQVGGSPFALNGTPVKLQVTARKILSWRAVHGVADPVPESPVTSGETEETITLVRYGAAKQRITAFPQLIS